MSLQIEVGKSYRARNGDRAVVKFHDGGESYPYYVAYEPGYHMWCAGDGRNNIDSRNAELLAPWTDDEPAPPTVIATAHAVLRARAIAHAATLPAPTPKPAPGQIWQHKDRSGYVIQGFPHGHTQLDSGWYIEQPSVEPTVYVAPDLRTFLQSDEGKAWLEGSK